MDRPHYITLACYSWGRS